MNSSIIQTLSTELARALESTKGIRAIYLFGSMQWSTAAADVDLAIVYGMPLTAGTASQLRGVVEPLIAAKFGRPAHLIFMNQEEADSSPLLAHSRLLVDRSH